MASAEFFQAFVARLESIPGVESAGITYFATIGVPLKPGRWFGDPVEAGGGAAFAGASKAQLPTATTVAMARPV